MKRSEPRKHRDLSFLWSLAIVLVAGFIAGVAFSTRFDKSGGTNTLPAPSLLYDKP